MLVSLSMPFTEVPPETEVATMRVSLGAVLKLRNPLTASGDRFPPGVTYRIDEHCSETVTETNHSQGNVEERRARGRARRIKDGCV